MHSILRFGSHDTMRDNNFVWICHCNVKRAHKRRHKRSKFSLCEALADATARTVQEQEGAAEGRGDGGLAAVGGGVPFFGRYPNAGAALNALPIKGNAQVNGREARRVGFGCRQPEQRLQVDRLKLGYQLFEGKAQLPPGAYNLEELSPQDLANLKAKATQSNITVEKFKKLYGYR